MISYTKIVIAFDAIESNRSDPSVTEAPKRGDDGGIANAH